MQRYQSSLVIVLCGAAVYQIQKEQAAGSITMKLTYVILPDLSSMHAMQSTGKAAQLDGWTAAV